MKIKKVTKVLLAEIATLAHGSTNIAMPNNKKTKCVVKPK